MNRTKRKVLILFILFALYFVYQIADSYTLYMDMQDSLSEKELQIQTLQAQKNDLFKQLEYVETIDYVEKVAREKLGLVKEGETLLIIIEE